MPQQDILVNIKATENVTSVLSRVASSVNSAASSMGKFDSRLQSIGSSVGSVMSQVNSAVQSSVNSINSTVSNFSPVIDGSNFKIQKVALKPEDIFDTKAIDEYVKSLDLSDKNFSTNYRSIFDKEQGKVNSFKKKVVRTNPLADEDEEPIYATKKVPVQKGYDSTYSELGAKSRITNPITDPYYNKSNYSFNETGVVDNLLKNLGTAENLIKTLNSESEDFKINVKKSGEYYKVTTDKLAIMDEKILKVVKDQLNFNDKLNETKVLFDNLNAKASNNSLENTFKNASKYSEKLINDITHLYNIFGSKINNELERQEVIDTYEKPNLKAIPNADASRNLFAEKYPNIENYPKLILQLFNTYGSSIDKEIKRTESLKNIQDKINTHQNPNLSSIPNINDSSNLFNNKFRASPLPSKEEVESRLLSPIPNASSIISQTKKNLEELEKIKEIEKNSVTPSYSQVPKEALYAKSRYEQLKETRKYRELAEKAVTPTSYLGSSGGNDLAFAQKQLELDNRRLNIRQKELQVSKQQKEVDEYLANLRNSVKTDNLFKEIDEKNKILSTLQAINPSKYNSRDLDGAYYSVADGSLENAKEVETRERLLRFNKRDSKRIQKTPYDNTQFQGYLKEDLNKILTLQNNLNKVRDISSKRISDESQKITEENTALRIQKENISAIIKYQSEWKNLSRNVALKTGSVTPSSPLINGGANLIEAKESLKDLEMKKSFNNFERENRFQDALKNVRKQSETLQTEYNLKQVNAEIANSNLGFKQLSFEGKSSMDSISSGLKNWSSSMQTLQGTLESFLGTLGYGSVLLEEIQNASQRESNKMFIELNKSSAEEAQSIYSDIVDLVVRLPGNDKFLTNILSLSASQTEGITTEQLDNIGTATAEYYAAAEAKGQFSYETEKELRSYLFSGNTLAFRNSMISKEIDLLKGKNTVVERANALEEALTKTGFAGMATMDSYSNIFQRFKGRIEKGFADVGDAMLPVVKAFLKLYDFIDGITNSGLTVSILSLVSIFGLVTVGVNVASTSINFFTKGIITLRDSGKYVRDLIRDFNGLGSVVDGMSAKIAPLMFNASEIGIAEMEALSSLKADAIGGDLYAQKVVNANSLQGHLLEQTGGMSAEQMAYSLASSNVGKQSIDLGDYVGKDGSFDINKFKTESATMFELMDKEKISKLEQADINKIVSASNLESAYTKNLDVLATQSQITKNAVNTKVYKSLILNKIESTKQSIRELTQSELLTASYWKNTASRVKNYIATGYQNTVSALKVVFSGSETTATTINTMAENGNTAAKILNFGISIKQTLQRAYNSLSVYLHSLNLGTDTMVVSGNTIAIAHNTMQIGIHSVALETDNVHEATSLGLKARAIGSQIYQTLSKLNDTFATWLGIGAKNVDTASEVTNTTAKSGGIIASITKTIQQIVSITVTIIETGVTLAGAFAQGLFNAEVITGATVLGLLTAPLTVVILLIGALAFVVYEVGKSFGWWSDLGDVFEAISSGVQRLWNAFANSEPVQAIIKYFSDFFYTLQTFFGGIIQVVGVFWNAIFGIGNSGEFDIVESIINIFGSLGDVLMRIWGIVDWFFNDTIVGQIMSWLNPLGILLFHLDEIGKFLGQIIDAWNMFINSPLSTEMFGALGEAFDELKEPFMEIWDAFKEVGEAFNEVFGALFPESVKKNGKEFNAFVEIIRAIAQFIINYVVPAIKVLAVVIRVMLIPLRLMAFILQSIIGIVGILGGAFTTGIGVVNKALQSLWTFLRPIYEAFKFVYNVGAGVWNALTGGNSKSNTNASNQVKDNKYMQTQQAKSTKQLAQKYQTGKSLAQRYVTKTANQQVNYYTSNYDKVNVKTTGLTNKEANKTLQNALGGWTNYRKVTRS